MGQDFIPNWSTLRRQHRVIVFVHDVFLNLLQSGDADLRDCVLIVMDECHDTRKEHSYMKIAQYYTACDDEMTRPQVLGLTATPAWADTHTETMSRLSSLCEALGGAGLSR